MIGSTFTTNLNLFNEKQEEDKPVVKNKKLVKATKSDPNAPKRPLTAFFLFSVNKRSELKANNPDASLVQLVKLTAEAWKNLSEQERKVSTHSSLTLSPSM